MVPCGGGAGERVVSRSCSRSCELGVTGAACSICIDLPDDTLSDRVWVAETVALARSDPANPFAYRIAETLGGRREAPVTFVVHSIERRRMATDP